MALHINQDMVIDFKIPTVLKNLLIDTEEADKRQDGSYDEYADAVDVWCKNLCAEGLLTKGQWDFIVKKYPYPYYD